MAHHPAHLPAMPTDYLMVPFGGTEVPVHIPPQLHPIARRQFKKDSRDAELKAKIAGNQATLAYTIGGSIGGTLVTGGVIAVVASTGPVGLAGIGVIAIGAIITIGGVWAAHRVSNIRARYEHEAGVYRDLAGELL